MGILSLSVEFEVSKDGKGCEQKCSALRFSWYYVKTQAALVFPRLTQVPTPSPIFYYNYPKTSHMKS